MDFRQATALFADPDFDGEPVQIFEPKPNQPPVPPDEIEAGPPDNNIAGPFDPPPPGRPRYYVDNVEVRVATERVQYLDSDGKLITESLKDYSRKKVRSSYSSLDQFLSAWDHADRKEAILKELAEKGVFIEELAEQVGRDYDDFDLVCHVAFD
jgi:type I restriction enzyme R subunit